VYGLFTLVIAWLVELQFAAAPQHNDSIVSNIISPGKDKNSEFGFC